MNISLNYLLHWILLGWVVGWAVQIIIGLPVNNGLQATCVLIISAIIVLTTIFECATNSEVSI